MLLRCVLFAMLLHPVWVTSVSQWFSERGTVTYRDARHQKILEQPVSIYKIYEIFILLALISLVSSQISSTRTSRMPLTLTIKGSPWSKPLRRTPTMLGPTAPWTSMRSRKQWSESDTPTTLSLLALISTKIIKSWIISIYLNNRASGSIIHRSSPFPFYYSIIMAVLKM